MEKKNKRILIVGAHPDDPDVYAGGTACLLAKKGYDIIFLSLTNGSCGHMTEYGEKLVARRKLETQHVKEYAGLYDYIVLNHEDTQLEPTIANREELLRIERRLSPDVILTHRPCDYHPDHRATAQLVRDTSYLYKVPGAAPDTPPPAKDIPIYGYLCDPFVDPDPFRADALIDITPVAEEKLKLLDCHVSQVYEWLPEIDHGLDAEKLDMANQPWNVRREYLRKYWLNPKNSVLTRQLFCKKGEESTFPKYAEAFELSAYGKMISRSAFQALLSGEPLADGFSD